MTDRRATFGYRRRRRVAVVVLIVSALMLLAGINHGIFFSTYGPPRVAAAPDHLLLAAPVRRVGTAPDEAQFWTTEELPDGTWTPGSTRYGSCRSAAWFDGSLWILHGSTVSVHRAEQDIGSESLPPGFSGGALIVQPDRLAAVGTWEGHDLGWVGRTKKGEWASQGALLHRPASLSDVQAARPPDGSPLWVAWREGPPTPPEGMQTLALVRWEGDRWGPVRERPVPVRAKTSLIAGSGSVWLATLGPDYRERGEIRTTWETPENSGRPVDLSWDDGAVANRRVTGMTGFVQGGRLNVFFAKAGAVFAGSVDEGVLTRPGGAGAVLPVTDLAGTRGAWRTAWTWIWGGSLLGLSLIVVALGMHLLGERLLRNRVPRSLKGLLPSYATAFQRVLAYALDVYLLAPLFPALLNYFLQQPGAAEGMLPSGVIRALLTLHGILIVYGTVCEAAFGQTVGKWTLGITVAAAEGGGRPGWRAALWRNLGRVLDSTLLWPVGLGMLWFTARGQRLGDLMGRTVVLELPAWAAAAPRPRPEGGAGEGP